jgi:iron(III) transport system permease protein
MAVNPLLFSPARRFLAAAAALGLAAVLLSPVFLLIAQGLVLGLDAHTDALAPWNTTLFKQYALGSVAVAGGATAVALLWGLASAFVLARWELPCRRVLVVVASVPLAVPSYLAAYTWVDSLVDWGFKGGQVRSLPMAWMLMGLALSPYVFLPAWAALVQTPRNLMDSARLLGCTRWATFWNVELRLAAPALVGSCLLVTMEVLADFGTVEHLALDTWSTGIYRSWSAHQNTGQATLLALCLLTSVACLTTLLRRWRGAQSLAPSSRDDAPMPPRSVGTLQRAFALAVLGTPTLVLCVYPLGVLTHRWITAHERPERWAHGLALQWWDSFRLSLGGATLVVLAGALVVILLMVCHSSWVRMALRFSLLGYTLPGTVLALGLLYVLTPLGLGGSLLAVLFAYVVRYITVAATPIESAWLRLPSHLFAQARVLGLTPLQALSRVTWPLMRSTLFGVFVLAGLDVLKELPATLLLRPFGLDTLALHVYALASDERLAEAAPAALVLMISCLVALALALRLGALANVTTWPSQHGIAQPEKDATRSPP